MQRLRVLNAIMRAARVPIACVFLHHHSLFQSCGRKNTLPLHSGTHPTDLSCQIVCRSFEAARVSGRVLAKTLRTVAAISPWPIFGRDPQGVLTDIFCRGLCPLHRLQNQSPSDMNSKSFVAHTFTVSSLTLDIAGLAHSVCAMGSSTVQHRNMHTEKHSCWMCASKNHVLRMCASKNHMLRQRCTGSCQSSQLSCPSRHSLRSRPYFDAASPITHKATLPTIRRFPQRICWHSTDKIWTGG